MGFRSDYGSIPMPTRSGWLGAVVVQTGGLGALHLGDYRKLDAVLDAIVKRLSLARDKPLANQPRKGTI